MTSKLKVNVISDSGDNNFITSDGSGNLTTQKILYPAFEAKLTSDQSTPCLLYTSPSPRDRTRSRMPSSA